MKTITTREYILATVLAVICVIVGICGAAGLFGCSPVARSVPPISSSHSQLTATDYDAAENHFGGGNNMGLAPMPSELADARCQMLLERRDTASAVVLGLVGLTGAGGVATLVPKDATGDERTAWDLGLGITTLVSATTATVLGALVRSWSAEYERECISETPTTEPETADGGVP
jgi:hypothetical protein